ncbi:hypothetical protein vseg_010367 [Gypsophila vaccaria]
MGAETLSQKQSQSQSQPPSNLYQNVPRYEINELKVLGPVGRGAKGVVFHVRVEDSGEELALKVVLKSSLKKHKGTGTNKKACDGGTEPSRVMFEQKVLRELDHTLLPRLKGVVESQNIFGYAIDYCSGGNLTSLRKQQVEKMFSHDIIRFYAAEIVLALEYLHKKGIVYRDLKPDNILIQDNGHLMLVDFDLSTKLVPVTRPSPDPVKKPEPEAVPRKKPPLPLPKISSFCKSGIQPENSFDSRVKSINSVESSGSDSVGKSNSFVGTEEYVAPEIIQGNGHDYAVDWWSLGIVLHEMLYGTTPFRGVNRKETFYRILSKTPELVGETTSLRDLISKLLKKDPRDRISLEEIKGHDFFKGVDWEMIVRLDRPPYIPPRPEIGEGIDGINAIDVESIVYGIFKNKDDSNVNNNNDNDYTGVSAEGDSKCRKNDNTGEGNAASIDKESIKKDVWVEGLQHRPIYNDFLVF